ncbi:SUMO-activating enzyme subunit 2 isoform X1 [Cataglyphis hispanica]|uniref:SUMO-activating enzyme subunit 2 isoform X1 n=1 Tax=Cataglyphis hispanica TaxID=1086592 RepID=UPI00218086E1|nr:SUMO-activating enzyme subunit 2 isoform X1 [Cataglyphis hispanica]XP_050461617.1 SUMO-activating enzyme subunit 2 isoform X1 [Cataglyphis hispanica]
MATTVSGVFREELRDAILRSKVLVVGAGGIGCEILKNLVMSGFADIEIIDLDTIDVSNLNRQFLFQKKHVGKSKASVARETALTFNPDVKVIHYHDSITSSEFGLSFFKRFTVVLNALDNRAARNHVNRMCLAADIPLIESGTAGYEGQVELIKKGLSQCYECTPKAAQKTYPGCTIRNTPSEPIHCIVWAKHLFNQLFGEEDPDQDVSPDTADPEATDVAGEGALQTEHNDKGNIDRISTRVWAQSCDYDPEKLFTKLFHDDIKYLLSMDNLWKKRRSPTALNWRELPDGGLSLFHKYLFFFHFFIEINNILSLFKVAGCSKEINQPGLKDQQRWSISKCGSIFADSLKNLSQALKASQEKSLDNHLVWDKDDQHAMDFVAACANIRAHIFGIPQKSRFDIKSMAGNIIPAIATTNAIIAGMVVLHAFRVLENNLRACRSVYLRLKMNHRNQLLVPEKAVNPPNPHCYVCAPTPQAVLAVDTSNMTIKELEELVLKNRLNMIAPDVMIDGTGAVVISSEEGETESNNDKKLEELGIRDGAILKVDDFQQNYSLTVFVVYREKPGPKDDSPQFLILADKNALKPKDEEEEQKASTSNGQNVTDISDTAKKRKNDSSESEIAAKKRKVEIDNNKDNNDDICIIDNDDELHNIPELKKTIPRKRKLSEDTDCLIVCDDHTD